MDKLFNLAIGKPVAMPAVVDFRPKSAGANRNGKAGVHANGGGCPDSGFLFTDPELRQEWYDSVEVTLAETTKETLTIDVSYPREAPMLLQASQRQAQALLLGSDDRPGKFAMSVVYQAPLDP